MTQKEIAILEKGLRKAGVVFACCIAILFIAYILAMKLYRRAGL